MKRWLMGTMQGSVASVASVAPEAPEASSLQRTGL